MIYARTIGLFAMAAALINGLPAVGEHSDSSVSLVRRQSLGNTRVFCEYQDIKQIGRSVHHMQVSDTLACTDGDCEIGRTSEHSFGIEKSAEIGASLSDAVGGISAAISVTLTESWTNGKSTTCAATDGESVCIFVAVPYREVELSNRESTHLICENEEETVTAKIPVARGQGANYYCVRGKGNCRRDGEGYWVTK